MINQSFLSDQNLLTLYQSCVLYVDRKRLCTIQGLILDVVALFPVQEEVPCACYFHQVAASLLACLFSNTVLSVGNIAGTEVMLSKPKLESA